MRYLLVLMLLFAFTAGCNYTKNMRIASSESAAILGVTATLDNVSADSYDATKQKIVTCADSLLTFIDSGAISDLPIDELQAKLIVVIQEKTSYGAYANTFITAIMAYAKTYIVDVDSVMTEFPLALVKCTLLEVKEAAQQHRVDWR